MNSLFLCACTGVLVVIAWSLVVAEVRQILEFIFYIHRWKLERREKLQSEKAN